MAEEKKSDGVGLPYVMAYGSITKALEKIIQASTPDRFTQDYLATKLGMKGGNVKAVIPFLKRVGFLNSDGTPTDLYRQFRNPVIQGAAAAQALRKGFGVLYEMNEYAHEQTDAELKGNIVQVTGSAPESSTVKSIVGSFKALRAFADFDQEVDQVVEDELPSVNDKPDDLKKSPPPVGGTSALDVRLGYTINLNLPATADIGVYNAIFKSLKEHLLDQ